MTYRRSSEVTGADTRHLITAETGAFNGYNLDWLTLESQVAEFWKPRHLKVEVERSSTTWFDYRMLHPAMRAHLFHAEHSLAVTRGMRKFFLKDPSSKRRGNLFKRKPNVISTYLTAMHVADELAIPYSAFFDGAIEYMLDHAGYATTWERAGGGLEYLKFPPLSVLLKGEAVMFAREKFDRANLTKLVLPRHEMFQARNWVGTNLQKEFAGWAMVEARRRGENLPFALKALILRGFLNEREILRKFGADMVLRIRDINE